MKIIQDLSDRISEELSDAESYVKDALLWKDSDKSLADTFCKLSHEEMNHVKLLHDEVVRLIADARKKDGEPPAGMMDVYNYLHKKQIDHAGRVRGLQAQYKGI